MPQPLLLGGGRNAKTHAESVGVIKVFLDIFLRASKIDKSSANSVNMLVCLRKLYGCLNFVENSWLL